MRRAIIGYTGFVGGNLCRQETFSDQYNSKNIEAIQGQAFQEVVCSGMPAAKWLVNKNPEEDLATLQRLQRSLDEIETDTFTLISTVDVYVRPYRVDESTIPDIKEAHPYGLHRIMLEEFVKKRFRDPLIVRLPGLFGQGLKKNVIYDLIHVNQVENIHPESAYQYYDLKHLAADITKARDAGLGLLHITSAPIKTRTIQEHFFPQVKLTEKTTAPVEYDFSHATRGLVGREERALSNIRKRWCCGTSGNSSVKQAYARKDFQPGVG